MVPEKQKMKPGSSTVVAGRVAWGAAAAGAAAAAAAGVGGVGERCRCVRAFHSSSVCR